MTWLGHLLDYRNIPKVEGLLLTALDNEFCGLVSRFNTELPESKHKDLKKTMRHTNMQHGSTVVQMSRAMEVQDAAAGLLDGLTGTRSKRNTWEIFGRRVEVVAADLLQQRRAALAAAELHLAMADEAERIRKLWGRRASLLATEGQQFLADVQQRSVGEVQLERLQIEMRNALGIPSVIQGPRWTMFAQDQQTVWSDYRVMKRDRNAARLFYVEVQTGEDETAYAEFICTGRLHYPGADPVPFAYVHYLEEVKERGTNVSLKTAVYYRLFRRGTSRGDPWVKVVPVESIIGQPVLLPRKGIWAPYPEGREMQLWAVSHLSDTMAAPEPWPRVLKQHPLPPAGKGRHGKAPSEEAIDSDGSCSESEEEADTDSEEEADTDSDIEMPEGGAE